MSLDAKIRIKAMRKTEIAKFFQILRCIILASQKYTGVN